MKIIIDKSYEFQFELGSSMDNVKDYQFVLGYRTWRAQDDRLYPIAQRRETPWPDETPYAAMCPENYCKRPASRLCACGFYAYNQIERAARQAPLYFYGKGPAARLRRSSYLDSLIHTDYVVGAVLGWGQVQFYGDGFRTEFARPLALIDPAFKYDIPNIDSTLDSKSKNLIQKLFSKKSESRVLGPPVPSFPKAFVGAAEIYNIPRLNLEAFEEYLERLDKQNQILYPNTENVLRLQAEANRLTLIRRTLANNAELLVRGGVVIGGALGTYKFIKRGTAGKSRSNRNGQS